MGSQHRYSNTQAVEKYPGMDEGKESGAEDFTEEFVNIEAVSESERCLTLDAAALLGGNEYLVQQLLDRLLDSDFTPAQEFSLRFATSYFWNEMCLQPSPSLASLLSLLTPLHSERLPRILASSLLYCSRYPETEVSTLPQYGEDSPDTRVILLSMANFPGTDPPIGRTPLGRECHRLAVLYHWAQPPPSPDSPVEVTVPVRNARKMSTSLALEKKMLSILDVFAMFPCP